MRSEERSSEGFGRDRPRRRDPQGWAPGWEETPSNRAVVRQMAHQADLVSTPGRPGGGAACARSQSTMGPAGRAAPKRPRGFEAVAVLPSPHRRVTAMTFSSVGGGEEERRAQRPVGSEIGVRGRSWGRAGSASGALAAGAFSSPAIRPARSCRGPAHPRRRLSRSAVGAIAVALVAVEPAGLVDVLDDRQGGEGEPLFDPSATFMVRSMNSMRSEQPTPIRSPRSRP